MIANRPVGSVGLFAYAVSDPELRFHDFLFANGHSLGAAGGRSLLWRPIGDPVQSDQVYQQLRSPELETIDQEQSLHFRNEKERLGDQRWYLNQEYLRYSKALGVDYGQVPFVVIGAPQLDQNVGFRIPIAILDDPAERRRLASILCSELCEDRLNELQNQGFFGPSTNQPLRRFIESLALDIYRLAHPKAKNLPSTARLRWKATSSVIPINPEIDTTLRWRIQDDGRLYLSAVSRGDCRAKVTFQLRGGVATKQQNLLHQLLEAHPKECSLSECIAATYPVVIKTQKRDPDTARKILKNLRSLFSDLGKTLRKHEFPDGIIPGVSIESTMASGIKINAAAIRVATDGKKGLKTADSMDPENLAGSQDGNIGPNSKK